MIGGLLDFRLQIAKRDIGLPRLGVYHQSSQNMLIVDPEL